MFDKMYSCSQADGKKKMYESSQFGSTGYSSGHCKVRLALEVAQNGGSVVSMPQGQGLPFPVFWNNMYLCFPENCCFNLLLSPLYRKTLLPWFPVVILIQLPAIFATFSI